MTVTTARLSGAAGLAAAASGLLYGLVQFIHPAETVSAVSTTGWAVMHHLTLAMAVLGLVGVTGIYLRQVREAGLLGLVGFVLFGSFYLLTVAFTFVEALVLPELAGEAPQLVDDLLGIFSGEGTGGLGAVTAVGPLGFGLYLLGGLALGVALFRARVLARWAAALLAAGTVVTLAVPLVPHSLARLAALPVAVAMTGLGVSLWRARRQAADPAGTPAPAQAVAVR
ncbi:hypothetical protein [Geodermatophilus sabuli]|uniref:hypothetical protein n=1 Tax=Geodermatophilus sabuli TaxID=1564158 RepID=UPI001954EF92|nr:hypothetical protein [Geodermatophilus sabuli]